MSLIRPKHRAEEIKRQAIEQMLLVIETRQALQQDFARTGSPPAPPATGEYDGDGNFTPYLRWGEPWDGTKRAAP